MVSNPGNTKDRNDWQTIDPILQALCDFEQKKAEYTIVPRHFAIRKTWLANAAYLPRLCLHLLSFSKPPLSGMFRKHILGLLTARLKKSGTYRNLASEADAVQLKLDGNRLRAFYLPSPTVPDGLSLKIIPKRGGISNKTRDELKFRQKLTDHGTITVPKIENVQENDHFLYVSEELIQGQQYKNRKHAPLFISQGIPELCATYRATGTRFEPLGNYYSCSLVENLQAILGNSVLEADFLKTVQQAFLDNPEILIGTCHQDLLPSNLCVAKGKLYFFDWEMVSEGPILADLLKLPFKGRTSNGLLEAASKALAQNFPAPSNAYQLHFAVYIADRIVKNGKKKKLFLNIWKRHHLHFSL